MRVAASAAALASAVLVLPGSCDDVAASSGSATCASPAHSISSCGASSDHLKNVCIELSPDPIEKGKPFTLTLSGDLDADLDSGSFDMDLDVKALGGLIDDKLTKAAPFTLSPAALKGSQKIVLGPMTLPSDIPGEGHVTGKVKLTNAKKEPVACVNLNLNVPAMSAVSFSETAVQGLNQTAASLADWQDCSQSSDHLKNFKTAKKNGVTTTSGTLDEDITKVVLDVDLKLHKLFVNIPLKMEVPVSYSPGIPKGDFKATVGPDEKDDMLSSSVFAGIDISGTVKANDGRGQEIACAKIEPSEAEEGQEKIVV